MKIVIVDDELSICKALSNQLKRFDHQVSWFTNSLEAMNFIRKSQIDLVISDIKMPNLSGFKLLEELHISQSATEIILMTGSVDVKDAVSALRRGAFNYITKPINLEELIIDINRVEQFQTLRRQNWEMREKFDEEVKKVASMAQLREKNLSISKLTPQKTDFSIHSQKMKNIFEIGKIYHNNSDIDILIQGETGTGKEVLANFIHDPDGTKTLPFVDVNCAAINHSLFEAELFGYEAGAFTGAKEAGQIGKLEIAEEGTVFLDEIGELTPELQAKLLRVLQEKHFYRVGGTKRIELKARVICATNIDLAEKVKLGMFRKDLFYRLQLGHIIIPPLRERKDDLIPLAEYFLQRANTSNHNIIFSNSAKNRLLSHHWDGNVRELKTTIKKAVLLFNPKIIEPEHLLIRDHGFKHIDISEDNFCLKSHILKIVKTELSNQNGNKTKTAKKLNITRRELDTYVKKIGNIDD
jgi:DNA-binding NtrC family response regulator